MCEEMFLYTLGLKDYAEKSDLPNGSIELEKGRLDHFLYNIIQIFLK